MTEINSFRRTFFSVSGVREGKSFTRSAFGTEEECIVAKKRRKRARVAESREKTLNHVNRKQNHAHEEHFERIFRDIEK